MRRYFAWKESGMWKGHKLLTTGQIVSLLAHLGDEVETFASIQTYKDESTIESCPVYADFDHKERSLAAVKADVQAFVWRMVTELNVIPEIYFSGKKGFHVILPEPVVHPHCHYIVRSIVQAIGGDLQSLDLAVYRPRAMFRLPLSRGSRPNYYKVRISRDELFHSSVEEIEQISSARRSAKIKETDMGKLQDEAFRELMGKATAALPKEKPTDAVINATSYLTPCIRDILQNGTGEGLRNKAVFLMAKFLKGTGITEPEATKLLFQKAHFREWEETRAVNIAGVVRSVWKKPDAPRYGCRHGADAEVMQAHCQQLCPFNPEFPELTLK